MHWNTTQKELIGAESKPLSAASQNRIKTFIDDFIRSQYVSNWTSEKDSDFWNEPERAERCADAAEFGCDGKTHAEVIGNWRDAFKGWLRDNHRNHNSGLFVDAVEAHFDSVETWHEKNGSLWQEIG
jgi:hypothetical protein